MAAHTPRAGWWSGRGRARLRSSPPVVNRAATPSAAPVIAEDGALVDRLERLAAMRRRGDLTTAEYETAKAATLAEAAAGG